MATLRRVILGAVLPAGVLGGVGVGAAGTAQAQGLIGGTGFYTPTGQSILVGPVIVAQFPALGVTPPYYPAAIGVPTSPDFTVIRGRADAESPQIGQFPQPFTGPPPGSLNVAAPDGPKRGRRWAGWRDYCVFTPGQGEGRWTRLDRPLSSSWKTSPPCAS